MRFWPVLVQKFFRLDFADFSGFRRFFRISLIFYIFWPIFFTTIRSSYRPFHPPRPLKPRLPTGPPVSLSKQNQEKVVKEKYYYQFNLTHFRIQGILSCKAMLKRLLKYIIKMENQITKYNQNFMETYILVHGLFRFKMNSIRRL